MILKALYDYYHAVKDMPPLGMDDVEIAYIIVIDKDGNLKRIESTKNENGNYAKFLVAKNVDRSSDVKPNILYDNAEYVLGLSKNTDEKNSFNKRHEAFIQKVDSIAEHNPNDGSLLALKTFLKRPAEEVLVELEQDVLFKEIAKAGNTTYITFQLSGEDEIIAQKEYLYKYLIDEKYYDSQAKQGICLITGKKGPIARTISKIRLPLGKNYATMVGAQKNNGFDSYGKEQAFNSPISLEAEFAFTTALNVLCKKGSKNIVTIGNHRCYIFWCSARNQTAIDAENGLYTFFDLKMDYTPNNSNKGLDKVCKVFNGIWSGEIKTDLDDRFYLLCMYNPSQGRHAVVSWGEKPLKDLARIIVQHIEEMKIIDIRDEGYRRPYCGVYNMLNAIATNGNSSNIPPNMVEELVAAIVQGKQYPFSLYTKALAMLHPGIKRDFELNQDNTNRIKHTNPKEAYIETDLNLLEITRIAILKAYINRDRTTNIKLYPMLDKDNTNPGYLCGRLAAVLEKIYADSKNQSQKKSKNSNSRYMGAASATPSAVFPTMLSVSIHHSEKIEKDSIRIFYEKLKAEIISKLPATGFPTHLNLIDQGCFFIGYYHQRADLYTTRAKDETIENNN